MISHTEADLAQHAAAQPSEIDALMAENERLQAVVADLTAQTNKLLLEAQSRARAEHDLGARLQSVQNERHEQTAAYAHLTKRIAELESGALQARETNIATLAAAVIARAPDFRVDDTASVVKRVRKALGKGGAQ